MISIIGMVAKAVGTFGSMTVGRTTDGKLTVAIAPTAVICAIGAAGICALQGTVPFAVCISSLADRFYQFVR